MDSGEYICLSIVLACAAIMQVLMRSLLLCADTFSGFEPDSSRWPFYRPWVAGCCPSATTLVASVTYAAWGLHVPVPVGAAARARARTVYVACRTWWAYGRRVAGLVRASVWICDIYVDLLLLDLLYWMRLLCDIYMWICVIYV